MSWRIMLMDGTCGMAMGHGALDDRLQLESRAASTGDLPAHSDSHMCRGLHVVSTLRRVMREIYIFI